MPPRKYTPVEVTPEAVVHTNWRAIGTLLIVSFAGSGIYWEVRAIRTDVDRLTMQAAEELKLRMAMQGDLRELAAVLKPKGQVTGEKLVGPVRE